MAPTLVFERAEQGRGPLVMVTGSPGGSLIIQFVVLNLIAVLDWNLSADEAVALPHFGAFNMPVTVLEADHPAAEARGLAAVAQALTARGHAVDHAQRPSGLATIVVRRDAHGQRYLEGGADPRREGTVRGD